MKRPRIAIWTMAAIHVLLFCVLFAAQGSWEYSAWWLPWAWGGISLGQGYLLGFWAALGGRPTPLRAIIVVVLTAIWWSISWQYISPLTDYATRIVTGQTIRVMVAMLLARLMGLELESNESVVQKPLRHLQFTVRQALA